MKVFEPATIGSITLSNHFIRSATAEGLANRQGFCSMPMSAFMPAVMSHSDTPMRPHSPGAPLMEISPLSAWASLPRLSLSV